MTPTLPYKVAFLNIVLFASFDRSLEGTKPKTTTDKSLLVDAK
jgi:hypothetical protein